MSIHVYRKNLNIRDNLREAAADVKHAQSRLKDIVEDNDPYAGDELALLAHRQAGALAQIIADLDEAVAAAHTRVVANVKVQE
jgi:sporulation-control protein spo0M